VLLLGVIFNLFNLEGTISPWWQWVLRGSFCSRCGRAEPIAASPSDG